MTLVYTAKLGLTTQKKNISAQKIDNSPLTPYSTASAKFSL